MIRYFAQGRFGPWYELDEGQWMELGGEPVELAPDFTYAEYESEFDSTQIRLVAVNTVWFLREDIKRDFPGLQDLIWFPDMRCGDCGGRLVDDNAAYPDKRYPNYTHATGMMDRHGAWPVERWDD